MAKILGRRNWGEKLKVEQKKLFKTQAEKTGEGAVEEKKDGGGEEDGGEGQSTALVVATKKKQRRKKKYEDDTESEEEEEEEEEPFDVYGNRNPPKTKKEFEELDGPDSDDDDAVPRKKRGAGAKSGRKVSELTSCIRRVSAWAINHWPADHTSPLPAPTSQVKALPAPEEVTFISEKNKEAMEAVLSMGKESKGAIKKAKDGKKKTKKKKSSAKAGDGGLGDIMKLGAVKINQDFM